MARTESIMVPIGTPMPEFALPDTNGEMIYSSDFTGKPLLVMFICNHCPYVKHIRHPLAKLTTHLQKAGFGVLGINSNDAQNYPEDSPEMMAKEVKSVGYTFPYLFDESQEVAHAFNAACTPDFFLYDADHKLVYRGRFDSSTPGNDHPVTGDDLHNAAKAVLHGDLVEIQYPSLGCNIKWR